MIGSQRGADRRLADFRGRREATPEFSEESLIFLEIGRNTDAAFIADLSASIGALLDEVAVVVGNWVPMSERARAASV